MLVFGTPLLPRHQHGAALPVLLWLAAALAALLLPGLVLGWPHASPDDAGWGVPWNLLAVQALALAAVLAAGWWLWVRRPADYLRQQSQALADGLPVPGKTDPPPRHATRGPLGPLTQHLYRAQHRLSGLMQELDEHQREMHRMAMYDPLTGLPNRRLVRVMFDRAAAQAKRSGRPMALLFIDLDRFKEVNDKYGHPAGDELLLCISQRLREAMRGSDVIGRLGGDEFVALLPDAGDFEAIGHTVMRLLQTAELPVVLDSGQTCSEVSASIGVARFPRDGDAFDTLIQHADQAMYRAKTMGRGRYAMFQPSLIDDDERVTAGGDSELLHALDHGEMQLFFQPVIDTATGLAVGAEALMRWQHPQEGTLTPARFIHRAEESGQLLALGRSTLDLACGQVALWKQMGYQIGPLSINVSAPQFRHVDWESDLKQALARHHIAANELAVELTEGALMDDADSTRERVLALRGMGVSLVIDDFGSGLISLSRLGELKPAMIKLDPAFLKNLADDKSAQDMVAGIVSLATNLSIAIVAEGVETEAQRDMLARLGCSLQQGFLFARPEPALPEPAWPIPPWADGQAATTQGANDGDGEFALMPLDGLHAG